MIYDNRMKKARKSVSSEIFISREEHLLVKWQRDEIEQTLSFAGAPAKYDIGPGVPTIQKMGKGSITLTNRKFKLCSFI